MRSALRPRVDPQQVAELLGDGLAGDADELPDQRVHDEAGDRLGGLGQVAQEPIADAPRAAGVRLVRHQRGLELVGLAQRLVALGTLGVAPDLIAQLLDLEAQLARLGGRERGDRLRVVVADRDVAAADASDADVVPAAFRHGASSHLGWSCRGSLNITTGWSTVNSRDFSAFCSSSPAASTAAVCVPAAGVTVVGE